MISRRKFMKNLLLSAAALIALRAEILFAQEELHYEVNPDLCIGCDMCLEACKYDAIEMREDKAFILQDMCIQCGDCFKACSVKAIKELKTS